MLQSLAFLSFHSSVAKKKKTETKRWECGTAIIGEHENKLNLILN